MLFIYHSSLLGPVTEWWVPIFESTLVRFEIVPFSKINPNDYMTISIRGVTHYSNGELDYQDRDEAVRHWLQVTMRILNPNEIQKKSGMHLPDLSVAVLDCPVKSCQNSFSHPAACRAR